MKPTRPVRGRRRFIATAGLALALPRLAQARLQITERHERHDLSLWYERPAGPWVEALPVGNGRLGAMVFGRPAQERLQLNIDTLFGGGPYNPDNPAALEALPRVRALIDEGHFHEAQALASKALMARPLAQMPHGSAGDLFIETQGLSGAAGYRRWLDLDSAVAVSRFTDGTVRRRRELFCSEPDQVLVLRIEAQGGSFDLDIGYRHSSRNVNFGAEADAKGAVALAGAEWGHRETERPATLALAGDGAGALLIQGRNIADAGIASALRFALRIKAVGDGRIAVTGDRIQVRGARTLTLLIGGATSFVSPTDVSGDPVAAVRGRTEAAARRPHALLKQRYLKAHQALFRRMSIRLGAGAADPRPTHERIFAAATEVQPELDVRLAPAVPDRRQLRRCGRHPGDGGAVVGRRDPPGAALPSAWPEGAVRGVRARGGIERDLAWAGASPQRPSLRGRPGEAVQLRYRARAWTVRLDGQGRARVDRFTA